MLVTMLSELAKIDAWLDDNMSDQYHEQPLAHDWARISKVIEEAGDAVSEFILHTGQNPRKPQEDRSAELISELADTAITAILAMIHFTKDTAMIGAVLMDRTQAIGRRAVEDQARRRIRSHLETPELQKAIRELGDTLGR